MNVNNLNTKPNVDLKASSEHVTTREASSFPEKVFQILEQSSDDSSLWWTTSGHSFCVLPKRFDQNEAVRTFQGTQFSSITRRLFRYGFNRVAIGKGCNDFPAGALVFENEFFCKGRPDLLKMIKIDNKRLYRKAIQRDELSATTTSVRPAQLLIKAATTTPPLPTTSTSNTSNRNSAVKLELLLRMERLRWENERRTIQSALESQCLEKALLVARLRAMNEATVLTRPLSYYPRDPHIKMAAPLIQRSNNKVMNELLAKSLFPGTRYFSPV